MISPELLDLCGKLRDQTIAPDEVRRLELLLQESGEAGVFFVNFMWVTSYLEQRYCEDAPISTDASNESVAELLLELLHHEQESEAGLVRYSEPAGADASQATLTELRVRSARQVTSERESPRVIIIPRAAVVGGLAAALIAIILVVVEGVGRSGPGNHESGPVTANAPQIDSNDPGIAPIARVTGLIGVQSGHSVKAGASLFPGDPLHILDGAVEISFSNGARVIVDGPAELTVTESSRIELHGGRLVARVTEESKGFTVLTPSATIVDVGTEFGVTVDSFGEVQTTVFDGKVWMQESRPLDDSSYQHRVLLTEGHSCDAYANGRIALSSRPSEDEDVLLYRRDLEDRPLVLLAKTHHDEELPVLPGGCVEDARVHVDREHELNGVDGSGLPSFLVGGDIVLTACNDELLREAAIDLYLSGSANVYILLYEEEGVPLPEWITSGFDRVADTQVGIDGRIDANAPNFLTHEHAVGPGRSIDQVWSVFHRRVDAPQRMRLGGTTSSTFYGIVVTKSQPVTGRSDN